MTTLVTRHFATQDQANAAVAALRHDEAFIYATISVIVSGSPEAASYGSALAGGGAVVVVNAPFGFARAARFTLGRFGGTDIGVADTTDAKTARGELFSDFLGLPLLSKDPTPLSSFLGMETLDHKPTSDTQLVNNPAPLSSLFGLRVLSRRQTSSTKLVRSAAPFSRMLGLPTLTRRQTSRTKLINNPAPLSSFLRLKVLSDD